MPTKKQCNCKTLSGKRCSRSASMGTRCGIHVNHPKNCPAIRRKKNYRMKVKAGLGKRIPFMGAKNACDGLKNKDCKKHPACVIRRTKDGKSKCTLKVGRPTKKVSSDPNPRKLQSWVKKELLKKNCKGMRRKECRKYKKACVYKRKSPKGCQRRRKRPGKKSAAKKIIAFWRKLPGRKVHRPHSASTVIARSKESFPGLPSSLKESFPRLSSRKSSLGWSIRRSSMSKDSV